MSVGPCVRPCSTTKSLVEKGCAIAVSYDQSRDQWHAGLAHVEADDRINFLHLAWHATLRSDEPYPGLCWVDLALPRDRALSVAARCRQVWRQHAAGGLPYAFKYAETSFTGVGELRLGVAEHGLTCATFIMAIFASVGTPLLLPEEWPVRPEDSVWHARIIEALKQSASPEHVAVVEKEVGCARFRPTEVAACSTWPALAEGPASFGYASVTSRQIEASYESASSEGACGVAGDASAIP